jgi:DNA-binding transcriptional LysR family regulator
MVVKESRVTLGRVDLNMLVALDALLSERNVTRAAERCSLGQPAMSAALARLRKYFDDPLLVREGKIMVTTPAADALAPLVRDAIAAVEEVFGRERGFDPHVDRRSFTIMASDYVTLILLRQVVARLAIEAPLQRLNVVPVQQDFDDQLRQRRADALVLPTELAGAASMLPHRDLFSDRYVLVADRNNDAVGPVVTPEQFAQLPYLAYSGGPLPSIAESQLDSLGVSRRVEMSTQSFVIAPFLITGTQFVALVHERLARHVAAQANLKIVEAPVPMRPISEALFWHARNTADPAHTWLREQIASHAEDMDNH